MPRVPLAAAILNLIAGLAWGARLTFGATPWNNAESAMLAADLVVVTAIAVVATLLSPSRWVRNLTAALGVSWGALAVTLTVDPLWAIGGSAAVSGVALSWAKASDGWFRGATKPDRVPTRAAVLALLLLALPGAIAATGLEQVTRIGWVLAGVSLALAWTYTRAIAPTLWILRLVVPIVGSAAVIGLQPGAGAALGLVVAVLTWLAWTPDARLAVQPLLPKRVEAVSILPEMVPTELMESAGFDRKGRPKGST